MHQNAVPCISIDKIELFKTGDDSVVIQVGGQKRKITLPRTLYDAEMLGAEFDEEVLVVKFKRPKNR